MLKSIAIFCGSSPGSDDKIIQATYETGAFLAQKQRTLVYGGGKVGLMGKVAQGALDKKGHVIGVIPHFLKQKEVHHKGLSKLLLVNTMHERKLRMHQLSDGVIMLPGGFGTFEEFFEMLTWTQLGLHQKPMGILNVNGFYDALIQMFDQMVANRLLKVESKEMVLVEGSIDKLLEKMESYAGYGVPKWMDWNQTQVNHITNNGS
ncbi:MAG: TIGR00730 family Rossman fold protein [Bacteroidota bacterium]